MSKVYRVWLHYLDCTVSRSRGRKVPKTLCIDKPSAKLLLDICTALNLRCQYIEGRRHPKHWFRYSGVVEVEYSGRKAELIKLIAKSVKERVHKA